MKDDLLRIETMSSMDILSRVASSLREELSVINDGIIRMEKELNSKENNPKWYNYSCEYDLQIYYVNRDRLELKLSEIESIIDDILERDEVGI